MSAPLSIDAVHQALTDLRARRPLVHNITNYVAMSISANVLLALGASPAMVHAAEEVEDFVAISDALVVNIGTLSSSWVSAMHQAAAKAGALGKPWVLDPVGCGATPFRTRVSSELAALGPAVIRGNASEILSLAGSVGAAGRGVDSTAAAADAAGVLAPLSRRTGSVVAVTGAIDYVGDGTATVAIEGGHALMPLSTAMGCSLSAVTAAFCAVRPPREAAIAALAVFAAAGAEAAGRCRGPGHLPAEICDALYTMDCAMLARHVRLSDPAMPHQD
ncbi:hydroxyethylthiazole kinase [Xanthobacteraceae bacterium Astr-EGSB]|uniref:hydroxyethylthiazole kinase n=1 Tax=Astrobacterium formosum TaxID=3069710 RepID=UPI0027B3AC21|nr:hydroxyethylthiazole kinase [Xanthobacteraceae bacterium Astr-EGSB]